MKKHKIFFLIPTLDGGGAERVMTTLLKHMDYELFNVYFIVVNLHNQAFLESVDKRAKLVDLNIKRVRNALPKIIYLIWKHRPKLVFSTLGYLNLALASVKFLLPSSVRTIARETNLVSYEVKNNKYPDAWIWLYKAVYKRHDLIICQSQDMLDDIVEIIGVQGNKLKVINNPVDIESIKELADCNNVIQYNIKGGLVLISAGRLAPQKGFDVLIEAISLIDADIHLIIAGTGMEESKLKFLSEEKGVSDRVHFIGFQNNLYAWIACADAYILSSRYEGFPNVLLEALACGKSIIATPTPGGIKEILSDIEGCVITNGMSAKSLADGIKRWRNLPYHDIKGSDIAKYSAVKICQEYQKVFISLCNYE